MLVLKGGIFPFEKENVRPLYYTVQPANDDTTIDLVRDYTHTLTHLHISLKMKHEGYIFLVKIYKQILVGFRPKEQSLVMCFLQLIVLSMIEEYLYL